MVVDDLAQERPEGDSEAQGRDDGPGAALLTPVLANGGQRIPPAGFNGWLILHVFRSASLFRTALLLGLELFAAELRSLGRLIFCLFLAILPFAPSPRKDPGESTERIGPPPDTRIKILFLCADSFGNLHLSKELRYIMNELQSSKQRDQFILHFEPAVRVADFSRALLQEKPNIVHFAGHGSKQGAIYAEADDGGPQAMAAEALSELLAEFADSVRCVVLNACYSAAQAGAIARWVPYVIAMPEGIGDAAAICFSKGFYQALGAGKPIPTAFRLALLQVRLSGLSGRAELIETAHPASLAASA